MCWKKNIKILMFNKDRLNYKDSKIVDFINVKYSITDFPHNVKVGGKQCAGVN